MRSTTTPRHSAELRPDEQARPNFWARRLGALAVLGVVGYAAFTAFASVLDDDDGGAVGVPAAAEATTAGEPDGSEAVDDSGTDIDCAGGADAELCAELGLADDVVVVDPEAVPAGDVETIDTAVVEEEERVGPPTADSPAKVFIVGDSDAGTFGPYLETLLDGTLVADTYLDYKVSSGLARPDFFNWPEELAAKLPEVDPDIVVATFGGNDSQGLTVPELRSDGRPDFIIGDPVSNEEEWSAEYEQRAGEVMDLLLEDDRKVIWVGIPNDDNPEITEALAIQDEAVRAAAAARPDVVFVDTWSRFSGRDGGWAEFVVDPRDNQGKDVRADDGFHLNQNGAEILAVDIAIRVQDALRDLGADL